MSKPGLVFLAGCSGCGKSTIGRLLSRFLKCRFVDLDSAIEKQAGMSVGDVFSSKGEAHFRKIETRVLETVCENASRVAVVALGGGTLVKHFNRVLIRRSGVTIYLKCSQVELYRRMRSMNDRPLLAITSDTGQARARELKSRIRSLLKVRHEQYEQAEITVSTTHRTPRQVARLIRAKLQ